MIDKQFGIFILHIIVGLFLTYLAYMIINNKKIPFAIGIILVAVSIFVIGFHIYIYFFKKNRKNDGEKLRGYNFNAKDKTYDIIGGLGGINWI